MELRPRNLLRGCGAGLAAGIVFGVLVGMAGILPKIAELIGMSSPVVGYLVNLVISVIVAVVFVAVFGNLVKTYKNGVVYGLIYGVIWWILGPLVIMPLWLGAPGIPLFDLQAVIASWPKLLMHLVYGVIVGVGYVWLSQRSRPGNGAEGQRRQPDGAQWQAQQPMQ